MARSESSVVAVLYGKDGRKPCYHPFSKTIASVLFTYVIRECLTCRASRRYTIPLLFPPTITNLLCYELDVFD
jgi:hypothetical protein